MISRQLEDNFPARDFAAFLSVLALAMLILLASCVSSLAAEAGAPIPPEEFSDDYYKVYGTPNLTISLDQTRIYQGEQTSLVLTLTNRGRITSFQVNEEPGANRREEILAAQKEQELEKQRTVAQDVSVRLMADNASAIDIQRAAAFPGNIREGQTSARLEFPVEAYENALPGRYRLLAFVNYTYQRDVAVEGEEDRPENPDVFYWYDGLSQTIPLTLTVQRRSGAEFEIVDVSPPVLLAGSQDNVIRVVIKNVGHDTARDLVARLRPESGLYVSVDESPIPSLQPQQEAELLFKLDVSQDTVPGKRYRLMILFEFSDSYRDDLTDSESAYLVIEPESRGRTLAVVLLFIVLAAALIVAVRKRGKS